MLDLDHYLTLDYWLRFGAVVIMMALVDICYAKYTLTVANLQAVRAAGWASAIIGCSSFITVSYVGDKTLVIAAIIGAFIGTYLVVSREKPSENQSNRTGPTG